MELLSHPADDEIVAVIVAGVLSGEPRGEREHIGGGAPSRRCPWIADAVATASPAVRGRGRIEIDVAGARIRVENGVDQETVHGVGGGAGRPLISFRADLKIMLAAQPVDFRKSVHTLSALVSEALRADCGDVFIFRSKRSDRVKLL